MIGSGVEIETGSDNGEVTLLEAALVITVHDEPNNVKISVPVVGIVVVTGTCIVVTVPAQSLSNHNQKRKESNMPGIVEVMVVGAEIHGTSEMEPNTHVSEVIVVVVGGSVDKLSEKLVVTTFVVTRL